MFYRFVTIIFIAFSTMSQAGMSQDGQPRGTFYSTLNSSIYVSFDSFGTVSTNIGVFYGAQRMGTWTPSGGLRHSGNANYYFPASINLATNNGYCGYFAKIEVFEASQDEVDLSVTAPSQWRIDSSGHCIYGNEITSVVTFKK